MSKRYGWFTRSLVSLLMFSLLGCNGGAPTPQVSVGPSNQPIRFPFIISATPLSGTPALGTQVKLVGNNFGNARGTVTVYAGNSNKLDVSGDDIISWHDSEIVFQLPTKDASGNVLLSTNPLIGEDSLTVTTAAGTANPTNSDGHGTAHPATLQIVSTGIAKVTVDKGGRSFSGQSLEYKIVFGSGTDVQTAATFATAFNNQLAAGDLEKLFNLPTRTDYQLLATIYSGPVATLQAKTVATGDIVFQASPIPVVIGPGQTTNLTINFPCTDYVACDVQPSSVVTATPQPTLAPGQVPTPTPPTPAPTPTPTPAPTATPPAGVTPETVTSFGTITTIAGTGATNRGLPSSRTFTCTGSGIGLPWSVALDSSNSLFFTMDNSYIAKYGAANCNAIVISGENAGSQSLEFMQAFTFVGAQDDLYITDNHNTGTKWRVVKVTKKSDGSYDFAGGTNLDFGSIALEFPTSVKAYKGKIYVVSSDFDSNGGGQSYVIEYNPSDGTSRVVAGNGSPNYSGDGVAATSAGISPSDIGFGPVGTAFEDLMVVSDGGNNALRGVNLGSTNIDFHGTVIAPGNIATIVGKNSDRYATLTSAPQRYFNNYPYRSFDSKNGGFTGDNGSAVDAKIDWPFAPRFDAKGRLYFADADNHRIRVVDLKGIIHTLVGSVSVATNNGHRGFSSPNGNNVDRSTGNSTISNGDGGAANTGDINHPMDMTLVDEADGSITMYIAETDAYRIRRVTGIRWQ